MCGRSTQPCPRYLPRRNRWNRYITRKKTPMNGAIPESHTGTTNVEPSRKWWIVGGVVLAVLVVLIAYLAGRGWEGANDQIAAEDDPAWVYKENGPEVCEKAVLPQLKSPGSAVFTWEAPREDTVSIPKRDRYLMDGYVDSQNGFGAVLRTNIVCGLTLNGDDTLSGSATLRK